MSEHLVQNILPAVVDEQTKILIVGSMPGIISLEKQQYYGNSRNHFWAIMSRLLNVEMPAQYEAKLAVLKAHEIGLWDVIQRCERAGSLDSAIKKEVPNDFRQFLTAHPNIIRIVFNGGKAESVFKKHFKGHDWGALDMMKMPSTSPVPGRNVKSFDEKVIAWSDIMLEK